MAVFFNAAKSRPAMPGPISVSRPTFPYVPATGITNAFGLKYWLGPPSITLPENAGFHDGRTGLRLSPLFDGLNPSCGVNGNPDWIVSIPVNVQPDASFSRHPLARLKNCFPEPTGKS